MISTATLRRSLRHSRLVSGLVMFSYVLCHFSNHAAGLISLAAMNRMLHVNTTFWMGPIGRPLVYTALGVHFSLALAALYRRRSLRMSPMELTQLLLGFSLPFLAAQHIVNTRVGNWALGVVPDFSLEVYTYWVAHPWGGVFQEVLMLSVWTHAMIGLHYRLKLMRWYPQWRLPLFALAVLWPACALLGFAEAGREVGRLLAAPAWLAQVHAATHAPTAAQQDWLYAVRDGVWLAAAACILAVLLARWLRLQASLRQGVVQLLYPGNRTVSVAVGTSVLEASRMAGIPHASICGGRGRCSTCRVHVMGLCHSLPPPSEQELQVLHRVGAPPNVRLACQLRPQGALTVTPLLPPTATARDGFARAASNAQGVEREIAILFADIRGFTRLAEHKLPYDVVFLLNRYFAEMGRAVESAGGRVDKFIGDGVMAWFGLDCEIGEASRRALRAAAAMSTQMRQLNAALAADLAEPLRIGIGLHSGMAIVGEMGYGRAVSMTAIGDAVNTASRLESQCKVHACELVVSATLAQQAGVDLSQHALYEVEIRGRDNTLAVYAIDSAQGLVTPAPSPIGVAPVSSRAVSS